ncbi:hypothetical protein AAL_05884 [Moelleriella libera RCEF 2490]|uniref:DUF6594 domain-containing protein n=1 Tax=Moelleriella libera RCEF 2490 TaxID=1081109 RepID=A0A167ZMC7_9HYPO|nr:hypothetical protein AAL_05884 [Moelleriella libera RCEF 2490]
MLASIEQSQVPDERFHRLWEASTADGNLTLHGFRRFKTIHLLNLRYLELEIGDLDRLIHQLGHDIQTELPGTGPEQSKEDDKRYSLDGTLSMELKPKLRQLLREYDEALLAFNKIMSLDTFSLLDDEKQCSFRTDLSLPEMFETRLLRVDRAPRLRQDPLEHSIRRVFRWLRYIRISRAASSSDAERAYQIRGFGHSNSQNTALIAKVVSRVILAAATITFLM